MLEMRLPLLLLRAVPLLPLPPHAIHTLWLNLCPAAADPLYSVVHSTLQHHGTLT